MNPYYSDLKRGDKISFRPRFTQQVVTGTVLAIHKPSTDSSRVKRVYVEFSVRDDWTGSVSRDTQWVRPYRIYHVIPN